MSTFLKKISKLGLMKHSFKKYLLYAIGEIVLIVFSLLLALQINQLYQNRQDKKLQATYYQMLIEDFQTKF